MKYEYSAPCLFGVESVLKKEILDLGLDIVKVEDGRITFSGGPEALCKSNIGLRTAERILLNVGQFEATTFDELFEKTKALPWEQFIPVDGMFWVKKASSIKSKLFSASDIQSIVKKAIVERLKGKYNTSWFKEDGAQYPIRVFIHKDQVTIGLDASGDALHKRGYRDNTGIAPLGETLAAAIVYLSQWRSNQVLIDPMCGSGTIPIEAAMIAANVAPGLTRKFQAEAWTNFIDKRMWIQAFDEANDAIKQDVELNIQGYDKDFHVIKYARQNAINAGVSKHIHFQERPMSELKAPKKYGMIITNPPYGERLDEMKEVIELYKEMGKVIRNLDDWSAHILTSVEDFEKYFGRQANKKRKLYNGMIKTNLYQYIGPKPPRPKFVDKESNNESTNESATNE